MRSVTPLALGAPGRHEAWEFRFRTRLPYDMVFVADLLVTDAELSGGRAGDRAGATGTASSRSSRSTVAPWCGSTGRCGRWLTWMRVVAPVARPIFSWNHRSLMAEGAFGLARRLDTRLLATPVGVLLPA